MSTYKKKEYDENYNIIYDIDPDTDYMAKMNEAEERGDFKAAARYERMRNQKIASGLGGEYQPTYKFNYKSKYGDKITELRDKLENYESFDYDIETDENYKNLANVYHKNALAAQKNALAQAAATSGGRLSSNAIIAASLGYGNKMSELDGEIPELRQAAYNMYLNDKNDLRYLINNYESAEDVNYSKWLNDYDRRYSQTRDKIEDNRLDRQFQQNERSQKLSEALQKAVAFGYVTEDGAPVLGVNAGTPLYDTKNNDLATKLTLMQQLGYIPDEFAQKYGFSNGGDTLDRTQLNYTIQKDKGETNSNKYKYTEDDVIYDPEGDNNPPPVSPKLSNDAQLWASDMANMNINDRDSAVEFLLNNGVDQNTIIEILDYMKL